MNSEQIHDALNYLDEDLILSVEQLRNGSRTSRKQWAAIAACLCLLVAGAFAVRELGFFPIAPTPPDAGITPTNATPTNATQAIPTGPDTTDSSLSGNPQTIDNTTATLSPTDGAAERPSVLIDILSWTDTGFEGQISGTVDTDIFPVGTVVSVQYLQNINVEILKDGVLCQIPGLPDPANFPIGSSVCVRFCRSDTHSDGSVTLYAEAICPA